MNTQTIFNAMWTSIFFLSLVYLIFWGLRTLTIDWFRDQIFKLRDDLFDEVTSGLLSYDHPAYTILRTTMNGYIRFCHRLSLFHFLLYSIFIYRDSAKIGAFNRNWSAVLENLDVNSTKTLQDYKRKMETLLIVYLLYSSPFIAVFLFFVLFIGGLTNRGIESIRDSKPIRPLLSNIDSSAFSVGSV